MVTFSNWMSGTGINSYCRGATAGLRPRLGRKYLKTRGSFHAAAAIVAVADLADRQRPVFIGTHQTRRRGPPREDPGHGILPGQPLKIRQLKRWPARLRLH